MTDNKEEISQEEFKRRFVDNVIEISPLERYVKKPDGTADYTFRVCGAIRKDGKRCLAHAGEATDHKGIGLCISHDIGYAGMKSWKTIAANISQKTKLGMLLKVSENLEVDISNITEEILFQQSLILWYLDDIMTKNLDKDGNPRLDSDGNPIEPKITKEDMWTLKTLNNDMIRAKESAARIKGSMKLDAITVKQFWDLVFSFLIKELSDKGLSKHEIASIMQKMGKEVFAPMAATSLISGDITPIVQIPQELQDMRLVKVSEERRNGE